MRSNVVYLCLGWIIFRSASGQEIARQKCQEYGKAVYQKVDSVISTPARGGADNISTCAVFDNPLVVGGTPARVKEFPHMAVLGYASKENLSAELMWICGGSLISEKHVLTAAHCGTSESWALRLVRLGAVSLLETDDYVQEIAVDRFVAHPEYHPPVKYNDIAVLFLKRAATFTAFVRPACLNTLEVPPKGQAKATGFGQLAFDDATLSKELLKVDLDIIPNKDCRQYLRIQKSILPRNITEDILCAGHMKGGRDTCQGDSGGPLQVLLDEPYCMYSIVGVTSFGRFCGFPNSPGLYTKVDRYVAWIESVVWKPKCG